MNNHFEIENHRLVGYVDFRPGKQSGDYNASIVVLGFIDEHFVVHKFATGEAKKLFPPKGTVFAPNFDRNYKPQNGLFVSFYPQLAFDSSGDKDKYCIYYKKHIDVVGKQLKVIPQFLTDDGGDNYFILDNNGIISSKEELFIKSGIRIYHYKPSKTIHRLLPWWHESNVDTLSYYGHSIVINNGGNHPYDGQIDLTTDEQLVTWFFDKVLAPKWDEIWNGGKFQDISSALREVFAGSNLPSSIIESRLSRLITLSKTFNLESDKVKLIANSPWLRKSIEKTINENKASFFREFASEMSAEIDGLEKKHKEAIEQKKEQLQREYNQLSAEHQEKIKKLDLKHAEYEIEIKEALSELEFLQKELLLKQSEAERINALLKDAIERKEAIVKDFAVVRDVLGLNTLKPETSIRCSTSEKSTVESIDLSNVAMPKYKAFNKAIDNNLIHNNIKGIKPSVITGLLAYYNVLLVPHPSLINIILYATGKCRYIIEPVDVSWKTFDDLWQKGLSEIVSMSFESPDMMHYLILQNINMSYLPTYMQPLINLQNGLSCFFPHTQISFPRNLKVLCTITDEEVIPLSKQCLSYIGCIDKNSLEETVNTVSPFMDEIYGYLTPAQLHDSSIIEDFPVENSYLTYLDE